MLSRLVNGIQLGLLIIAYPVIIYLLLSYQVAWLGALLVFTMIAWKSRHTKNSPWWIVLLALGTLLVVWVFGTAAVLKMSPLLIHTSLFLLFTQSLRTTPLIERFARLDFGEQLPPGITVYCRKLTMLWAAFFAANIGICLWLAIMADNNTWILYNGLVVYLLIGALLLGEYLWRHIAFRELDIPSLAHTVRSLVKNGHTIWGHDKHDHA